MLGALDLLETPILGEERHEMGYYGGLLSKVRRE